jgi:hypothetical protein
MITDALLLLSSAQAVTASAVSTNTIDLGTSRDLGSGEPLYAVFTVDTTATAAGAATVNFQVISSAAANLGTPTVLVQTDAIAKTELTAGRRPIILEIPPSVLAAQPIGQRYLGVQYTVGTGPLTAGAFTCNLVRDVQDVGKYHASGFTVA